MSAARKLEKLDPPPEGMLEAARVITKRHTRDLWFRTVVMVYDVEEQRWVNIMFVHRGGRHPTALAARTEYEGHAFRLFDPDQKPC